MQNGVTIDNKKSLIDWQIIQQINGKGEISLSGSWALNDDESTDMNVYVRVLQEDSGNIVVFWTQADMGENHSWSIRISDIPVGGLYRIETCLNKTPDVLEWAIRGDMIHHIGIGDLYVISGQSNSAGYGKDAIYDPPEIGIHLLKNSGKWDLATHPMNDSTQTLHTVNSEGGNSGHSPYLSFAKQLKRELHYPIGLIQASLGGSPLSAWNPDEDGCLYENMMNIIGASGGIVKGVLWYQGCTDASEETCDSYLYRFKNMVEHLRLDLNSADLPVITMQLNKLIGDNPKIGNIWWGKIREAQRQAAMQIDNVFVVPTIDGNMSDEIHNSAAFNIVLGERIAAISLKKIYKIGNYGEAPNLSKAEKITSNEILLHFDNVMDRIMPFSVSASKIPFTVEDNSGEIPIKSYNIVENNKIRIELERDICNDINGCRVHGAYQQNPPNPIPMDNFSHIPMLSFYGVAIL